MNKSQRDIGWAETDKMGLDQKRIALRHFYLNLSTFHKFFSLLFFFCCVGLTRLCKVCAPYLHARDKDFANSHVICVQSRLINDSF